MKDRIDREKNESKLSPRQGVWILKQGQLIAGHDNLISLGLLNLESTIYGGDGVVC